MKLLLETEDEEKLIRKQSVDIRELYGICVKNNNSINPNIEVLVDIDIVNPKDNLDNMDETCAICRIFKEFADNPDVTCMDECVGQSGCSSWMGSFAREEIERYTRK